MKEVEGSSENTSQRSSKQISPPLATTAQFDSFETITQFS